ncbi:hypothetical protein ACIP9H_33665 [Streptomyces sp. NPDC088732]|uniref:hypothetical protein n=1 Tax=Streptomyces sp. NPDC088732 TaxID=3365879 RepID=UPI0038094D07
MRSSPIDGWTSQLELLAQIVEEVSILSAERRREEPKTVPRPSSTVARAARRTQSRTSVAAQAVPTQEAPRLTGHRQMLMAAMQKGMVRSG